MTYDPMGSPASGNYSTFEKDGTLEFKGLATVWCDSLGDTNSLQQTGTGVSRNLAEGSIDFITTANTADYIQGNFQLPHSWKQGSTIEPHIHWEQAQAHVPNFLIQYRWQKNGGSKNTAWLNYKCNTILHSPYVSGTLNQICEGVGITPSVGAYNLSDIFQLRIIRDTTNVSGFFGADPYTTTVGVLSLDIHVEVDSVGSRSEYLK